MKTYYVSILKTLQSNLLNTYLRNTRQELSILRMHLSLLPVQCKSRGASKKKHSSQEPVTSFFILKHRLYCLSCFVCCFNRAIIRLFDKIVGTWIITFLEGFCVGIRFVWDLQLWRDRAWDRDSVFPYKSSFRYNSDNFFSDNNAAFLNSAPINTELCRFT